MARKLGFLAWHWRGQPHTAIVVAILIHHIHASDSYVLWLEIFLFCHHVAASVAAVVTCGQEATVG